MIPSRPSTQGLICHSHFALCLKTCLHLSRLYHGPERSQSKGVQAKMPEILTSPSTRETHHSFDAKCIAWPKARHKSANGCWKQKGFLILQNQNTAKSTKFCTVQSTHRQWTESQATFMFILEENSCFVMKEHRTKPVVTNGLDPGSEILWQSKFTLSEVLQPKADERLQHIHL